MSIDWGLVTGVVQTVLVFGLAVVVIWLRNDRDMTKVKEAVAKMIGDALAMAVDAAANVAGSLTDEELDSISAGVYDFLVPRLPDGLEGLVLQFYPRASFQAQFRKVWREFLQREQPMRMTIARQ